MKTKFSLVFSQWQFNLASRIPNVQFPKRQLPKGQVRPSEAPKAAMKRTSVANRIGWGPSAAVRTGWGPSVATRTVLRRIAVWEIADQEKSFEKVVNIIIIFMYLILYLLLLLYTSQPIYIIQGYRKRMKLQRQLQGDSSVLNS